LLHEALRLQPTSAPLLPATAASRLATQFVQLLGQQFPIQSPQLPLRLSTAEAFAAQLEVHPNHLSRVLREVTGRTTSAHLAARVAQEAKALLRHTDWPIADIADSLAFTDPTYFNHFFRKHAGTSPNAFRHQAADLPLVPAAQ
jgi:AraC family transcriptional activator of pobA